MNSRLRIPLHTNELQHRRLSELQTAFAQVCNVLAPIAQKTTCWNRVALHHMAYKGLRQQFPHLGSQMICNAIYSVSRSCRLVYQHPQSPFNLQRLAGKALPLVHFLPESPVYFDRHTLSLKDGEVSMFTLDGRMRFKLALDRENEHRFRHEKIREIVLERTSTEFTLTFHFTAEDMDSPQVAAAQAELPQYVLVIEGDALPPVPPFPGHPAPNHPAAHT